MKARLNAPKLHVDSLRHKALTNLLIPKPVKLKPKLTQKGRRGWGDHTAAPRANFKPYQSQQNLALPYTPLPKCEQIREVSGLGVCGSGFKGFRQGLRQGE